MGECFDRLSERDLDLIVDATVKGEDLPASVLESLMAHYQDILGEKYEERDRILYEALKEAPAHAYTDGFAWRPINVQDSETSLTPIVDVKLETAIRQSSKIATSSPIALPQLTEAQKAAIASAKREAGTTSSLPKGPDERTVYLSAAQGCHHSGVRRAIVHSRGRHGLPACASPFDPAYLQRYPRMSGPSASASRSPRRA